jgi:exonuclease SbcC
VQLQLVKGDYERSLRADLSRVEAEIAALGALDALEREMNGLEGRIATLEQRAGEQNEVQLKIQAARQEIARIDADEPALHEHEQNAQSISARLAAGDFAQPERDALAAADAEIAALGYSRERFDNARAHVEELKSWEEEHQKLERAETWAAEKREELAHDEQALARQEAEIAALQTELAALDVELRALAPAQRERDAADAAQHAAHVELRVRNSDVVSWKVQLQAAEKAEEELLAAEAQRGAAAERKGLFDELGQAFGKKGLQALLIETAIPEIEREANELLGRMTDNQMHLTFETQGATKKGDTTETLEIKIADALGTRVYDAYSGGEAFRLDFAIRIALAKLLARRAGARLETLVIDEGFGSQDTRGRERLVEAITSVQPDFKRILVITHIQELKDMFPVQIEITKTPAGSRWAIA